MTWVRLVPLLLAAMVAAVVGLSVWSLRQNRNRASVKAVASARQDVLVWLLALAFVALGVFLMYAVLNVTW